MVSNDKATSNRKKNVVPPKKMFLAIDLVKAWLIFPS
jgi:hypothetical protein